MLQRYALAIVCIALVSPLRGRAQNVEVETVVTIPGSVRHGAPFLEGPASDADGNIYFTDIANDLIHRLGTDGRVSTFRQPGTSPAAVTFDTQYRLLATEGGNAATNTPARITRTDLKTGRVEVLADSYSGEPFGRPNDLTLDRQGRIYFSAGGEVYRLDADGRVTRIAASPLVQGSNGLVISLDDRTLYLVEQNQGANLPRRIRAFDLSPEGNLSSPRVFHDFYPGRGGDGMAIDVEGNLYVAAGMNELRNTSETLDNKAGIYVFSANAALIRMVPIPADTLTNLCFGGPDLKTVYVTSGNRVFKFKNEIAGTRR
jgi:gluconolactonase